MKTTNFEWCRPYITDSKATNTDGEKMQIQKIKTTNNRWRKYSYTGDNDSKYTW